jgi:hypothetical protein
MEKNANSLRGLKIVDHLHKKNCQLCGAFIINLDEDDDLNRYDSAPNSKTRCDSSGGKGSHQKKKQPVRVKVSIREP